jgi:hypothetical protein
VTERSPRFTSVPPVVLFALAVAASLASSCGAASALEIEAASSSAATTGAGGATTTARTTNTATTTGIGGGPATTSVTTGVGGTGGIVGTGGACCSDDQNPAPLSDNPCGQAAKWIAWKYVPSCSLLITRIELHTSDGSAALIADEGDMPGNFIFEATLGAPDANGWRGIDLMPPVPVKAGAIYWIGESAGLCSVASAGMQQPYYGGSPGMWEGPYSSPDHEWTAHITGACN